MNSKAVCSEHRRMQEQVRLDAARTGEERNKDGQFATPYPLALQIARFTLTHISEQPEEAPIRVLEPSCGSGAFISACLNIDPKVQLTGIELDKRFYDLSKELWGDKAEIHHGDYLEWVGHNDGQFDVLIANPPYVRHHHLTPAQKNAFHTMATRVSGVTLSKLAGLYVYFVLISHDQLAPGAVSSWLIPAEFMGVNYGSALRDYLTNNVTLERIHSFAADNVQFDDALVTSCVVTFRKAPPPPDHCASFTVGTDFADPTDTYSVTHQTLLHEKKWGRLFPNVAQPDFGSRVRLGDLFKIQRGIATGANKFFIMPRENALGLGISPQHLRPILPSPRNMKLSSIPSDPDGWPATGDQQALINCQELLETLKEPGLAKYLNEAPESVTSAYLVAHRSPWYSQEQRPPAPILCTYMGRGSLPFRFIRNRSQATVTNTYLGLFPLPIFSGAVADLDAALDAVWEKLASLPAATLRHAGREYGGGLQKLEPKELADLPADAIIEELHAKGLVRDGAEFTSPQLTLTP
jgi:adenine-specific DNA-methyltransferase